MKIDVRYYNIYYSLIGVIFLLLSFLPSDLSIHMALWGTGVGLLIPCLISHVVRLVDYVNSREDK